MDRHFGLYFLYVTGFMKKKNKYKFDNSKRKFNVFLLVNIFFLTIFKESKAKFREKEIKYKKYIWFLNENDR